MRESRDWRQDETHKATWNLLTTSLLLQLWRTKTNKQQNRRVKSHILSKENKISTELLLGIYLTKLNKEERRTSRQFQAWAEGRGSTPPHSLPLPFPAAGAESERDWLSRRLVISGFFLQYFDPPNPTPPPSFLSHGALISADQAFNLVMMEDSMLSYAYRTECKKKKQKKNYIYINQRIMNFARTFLKLWLWFLSFVNLVMKYCMNLVYIYFLWAKKWWESLETLPLPVAGEALPWKLNTFGPECSHVSLFTVLIVSLLFFLSLVEGREYLFF